MAQPGEADQARGRLPVLAALVAFTVATAIAFGRVYQGDVSTLKLVAAGAGAVLLAAALERLHVLLSTAASGAGLLLALGLLVFPETTAFGLPTGETLRAIRAAFSEVGQVASQHTAPVGPFPELLLAGVVAVWTSSFASHALVARAASGVLALLPAGALIAFADVVLEDGVRPAYMVLFLLSAFAMLSAVGLRSVVRWGRLVPWGRARRWSLFSTNALRAARRAAVPAALSAVLLPWMLPGLNGPGWWAIGSGSAPISIDPIVDLRPSLRLDPPRQLFTVDSPKGAYWRMLALDTFDGRRWTSSNLDVSIGSPVDAETLLRTSAEAGSEYRSMTATFEIDRLAVRWLPVPYEPLFARGELEGLLFDESLSTLGLRAPTERGLVYQATAAIVSPNPSQLDRQWLGIDSFHNPNERFTRLPGDNGPIAAITRAITDEWDTPYLKTLAIQDHLRRFTYDENARPGADSDYLLQFLTETQRGYCEQFAGAMAVMLRSIGIPSRVVVGFTPGGFNPATGKYHVTTRNAHSWVEVHFGPYGWLPFEPTPQRTMPTQQSYLFPVQLTDGSLAPGGSSDPRTDGQDNRGQAGRQEDQGGLGPGDLPETSGPGSAFVVVALLTATGLLAAAALVPLGKLVRRRVHLSRAREPAERVLAAYDVLVRRLGDLGLVRGRAETLWEYRDRVRGQLRLDDGDLERITRLAGRAAYAAAPVTPEQAEEAVALGATVAARARRSVSAVDRVKAIWHVGALDLIRGASAGRGARVVQDRGWAGARA